jgi:hypothetical protein
MHKRVKNAGRVKKRGLELKANLDTFVCEIKMFQLMAS